MKKIREKYQPEAAVLSQLKASREAVYPDEEYLKEWYDNYSRNHLNRLSFDLQYLKNEFPQPEQIQVLELGSTPPVLTSAIKNEGYSITGLDVDPSRFQGCIDANDIYIVKGMISTTKLPFEDGVFDAIIMNEVFEHLNTNLIFVISEIVRIMKPGGKLFISTPNLKSMVGIRNFLLRGKSYSCCGELYEEYEKIEKYGHMGHVREYTPTEVILFLEKFNLKVEKLIYRGKFPLKYRMVELLFPSLRPFFSVIATKS
ncbi:MAG: class I SAM-dependent methyltransferase [Bacteroidota bacterium]